jgi:glycosyltransferase involved in cell wall biosynthesis
MDVETTMTAASQVTLLITHYNRSRSLERLLGKLRELRCEFATTIVSDDASGPEHLANLERLSREYGVTILTSPRNRGLGHNINKGQDAVRTPYTLYVQEDFTPTDIFPRRLADALEIMDERREIDMVRFYAYGGYPYCKPYKNHFSEMIFQLHKPGSAKFFYYSDTPHLRRSTFQEKFGRYAEGVRAIDGEKCMVMSFLQAHGKAMVCDENDVFLHENSEAEPSTQDYSRFFAIKKRIPDAVFDLAWVGKLTAEYLLRRYRN